jgi:hypothetical protein
MGVPGIALERRDNITRRDKYYISLNYVQKTNDEMSTMTFDDLMSFVGANEYALAA